MSVLEMWSKGATREISVMTATSLRLSRPTWYEHTREDGSTEVVHRRKIYITTDGGEELIVNLNAKSAKALKTAVFST